MNRNSREYQGESIPGDTILIVEDDPVTAMQLERTLTEAGYRVPEPVATGEAAVESVNFARPDLVLMDISLGGEMDGVAASEVIGSVCGVPIIYITAHSDERLIGRAKDTMPYGYLLKPVEKGGLLAAVKTALHRHEMDVLLQKSEEKYRLLYENAIEAICVNRIVLDEDGRPVDYVFLDVNPAFERHTGLRPSDVVGKKVTDVFPEITETNLITTYGKVACQTTT